MGDARHLSDLDIQGLLDDGLEPARAGQARTHLAACRDCARRVEAQARLFAAIESWVDSPPPHDLAPRVVQSLTDRHTPIELRLATVVEAGLTMLLIALAWPVLAALLPSVSLPATAGIDSVVSEAFASLAGIVVAAEALLQQVSASMQSWLPLARQWMTLWPAIVAGALLVALLGNSILLAGDSAGPRGVRPRRL